MRDKIAHAMLWWGAQHVCSQVQQVWRVSACSVVIVPFELDVSVGHSASRYAQSHTSLVVQQFLAEKNFLVITQPPYSPISLRVTFGCFLLWKLASRGHVSQPWRTSNRTRRPNSGRFRKNLLPMLPTMAGSMEQVRVCARVLLWRWLDKRCHM
jgi:hypothetical protein